MLCGHTAAPSGASPASSAGAAGPSSLTWQYRNPSAPTAAAGRARRRARRRWRPARARRRLRRRPGAVQARPWRRARRPPPAARTASRRRTPGPGTRARGAAGCRRRGCVLVALLVSGHRMPPAGCRGPRRGRAGRTRRRPRAGHRSVTRRARDAMARAASAIISVQRASTNGSADMLTVMSPPSRTASASARPSGSAGLVVELPGDPDARRRVLAADPQQRRPRGRWPRRPRGCGTRPPTRASPGRTSPGRTGIAPPRCCPRAPPRCPPRMLGSSSTPATGRSAQLMSSATRSPGNPCDRLDSSSPASQPTAASARNACPDSSRPSQPAAVICPLARAGVHRHPAAAQLAGR